MVAWVVLDRRHHRQAGPFASLHSSPLFPLHHLSPLLPYSYGHSYTTATHQPLCNQSLTHSFYLDGGCTPHWLSLATAIPTHHPLRTSSSFFSHSCALFCTFLHFFALTKKSTPLFSIVSALFHKNTRGGVRVCVATTSRGHKLCAANHSLTICCGRDEQKPSTHTDSGTPQVPCQKSRTSRSCSLGLPADPFYQRPDPLTVC